ncbi:MAG: Fic family protein [Imperialibacter sp.]|uniref:Fic family protein n=1 Tax=Imperialibacter sp. TaxID=2038411 RepID=UPI0032EFBF23
MDSVAKALQLKKELDQLRPIKPEDERRIMDKFRLDWNYHSNNLEGNSLTYGETKALILFGITAQGKPLKDHFEITGHNEAIHLVLEVVKEERPLTENFIRELHKLLLKESYEADAITPDGKPTKKRIEIGAYKTQPNHVKTKTGEIFRFATPEETPGMMHDLMKWLGEKKWKKDINPVLVAAELHYKFIRIHPFDDGNGRVVRILMNFILMQYGFPPVIIKTEDKENYFAVLRLADAGSIAPFIEYIGDNLVRSLEIMIKGANGESIEEPDDLDKELFLLDSRINSIGENLVVEKSEGSISKFYQESIKPLFLKFLDSSDKFSRFYSSTSFNLFYEAKSLPGQFSRQMLDDIEQLISINTHSISIVALFSKFSRDGFEQHDYYSEISCTFSLRNTRIQVLHRKIDIKQPYSMPLTEKEIVNIVGAISEEHRLYIEKKIKEAQKL